MPDSRRLAPDPLPWRRRPPKGPRRDDPPWPEPPPLREVPQTVPQPEREPVPVGRDWNDPDFVSHVLYLAAIPLVLALIAGSVLLFVFQILIFTRHI